MLSVRIANLLGSPVRAMLAAAQQPGVISFAGGLPSPESFNDLELPHPPGDWLQYGPTEGEWPLRAAVSEDLAATGLVVPPGQVMILSGSQQGIDLAAKLLIDPMTPVAVESPSYLAALQAFRLFGADLTVLDSRALADGWTTGSQPRFAYVTPTFQNPTGRCWSASERDSLAIACDRNDVVLFEDDPYRELVYAPCERTPICARIRRASWIYQGSFSKTIAPGLRLGFLAASADLFPHLVNLKQAADLHSNRLSQWYVLNYLRSPQRIDRMSRLIAHYRHRRDRFAEALTRHLGDVATWHIPDGGLFFWATLKSGQSAGQLLERARTRGVLFTPGDPFMVSAGPPSPCLRLNFSHADEASADSGLEILSTLLREPN